MGNLTVREIAEAIVEREGGFVNDPDDPGGATNFGVTIGTMRALGLDLDGDGEITIDDVRELTREQAVDIFIEHYFQRPGIARLPGALQASVFDMYVNSGSNAVRILQRTLNRLGCYLAVDGVLGPKTAAAAHAEARRGEQQVVDAYAAARREFYYRIGDRRPASRKFARRRDGGKGGWILRAEEFMSAALRFTEEQHRARVSGWA